MKFDYLKVNETEHRVIFIPEDDVDVFNLGKVAPKFSCQKFWQTKKGDVKKLMSISIHVEDFFTIFCILLEKVEHHFIKRDL